MVIIVVGQVILRVFLVPVMGTLELSEYLLICIVFFSVSYATRDGEHISMRELQKLLPKRVRTVIAFVTYLGGFACSAIICYSAVISALRNLRNITPSLGMPMPVFFLPTIVGFALLTLEFLAGLVKIVTGRRETTA